MVPTALVSQFRWVDYICAFRARALLLLGLLLWWTGHRNGIASSLPEIFVLQNQLSMYRAKYSSLVPLIESNVRRVARPALGGCQSGLRWVGQKVGECHHWMGVVMDLQWVVYCFQRIREVWDVILELYRRTTINVRDVLRLGNIPHAGEDVWVSRYLKLIDEP